MSGVAKLFDAMRPHAETLEALPDNIDEQRVAMSELNSVDLRSVSIEYVKERVRKIAEKYIALYDILGSGTSLFRARVITQPISCTSELSCPPSNCVRENGRLNRAGEPVFYLSILRSGAVFEVKPRLGDKLAIAEWRLKAPLYFCAIGRSRQVFERLSANRVDDAFSAYDDFIGAFPALATRIDFLANAFCGDVRPGDEHAYKISIAISEVLTEMYMKDTVEKFRAAGVHLGDSELAGFTYPTMAMGGNADNVVVFRRFVERFLTIERAEIAVVLKEPEGLKTTLGVAFVSTTFGADGKIHWERAALPASPKL